MLLCIISCSLISCCIEDPPENDEPVIIIDDLREFDFELSIVLENGTYQSDESSMILEIVLRSEHDKNIELETYQFNFPEVVIHDPYGFDHTLFHGNISVAPHYQVLEENDEIRTEIDLKRYDYWNGTPFIRSAIPMKWDMKGRYQCSARAYYIKSNIEDFEIL